MATAKTKALSFITWNVNGLKERKDDKFEQLKDADVVFLQETHIGEGNVDDLIDEDEDKWEKFYTRYTSSEKGVAILVRQTINVTDSHEEDCFGSYIVLKCKLEGQPYTLVSIYNHHTDTNILDQLSQYLQSNASGVLVIGGDFNTVLNPFIDKETKHNTNQITDNTTHRILRKCVQRFIKSLQLVDVWRRINPAKQSYTFKKKSMMSRLDYFFIPEECMWRVQSCEIKDLQKRDHLPMNLKLNNVPTSLCKNEIQCIDQLMHHKKEYKIEEADLFKRQEGPHEINKVEIDMAIKSLQVSDTCRPDGIPVSFYKEGKPNAYLKVLYSRILDGSFDFSNIHFNASVQAPQSGDHHFFNADYLILAAILARRLDDHLESQSKRQIPKGYIPLWITFKTLFVRARWFDIKNEIEKHQSGSALRQDFLILDKLLTDAEAADSEGYNIDGSSERYKLLFQGCPLTPVLMTLFLKSYAEELFGHLEHHKIFTFRQSIIVSFQPKDEVEVKTTIANLSEDHVQMFDFVTLSINGGRSVQEGKDRETGDELEEDEDDEDGEDYKEENGEEEGEEEEDYEEKGEGCEVGGEDEERKEEDYKEKDYEEEDYEEGGEEDEPDKQNEDEEVGYKEDSEEAEVEEEEDYSEDDYEKYYEEGGEEEEEDYEEDGDEDEAEEQEGGYEEGGEEEDYYKEEGGVEGGEEEEDYEEEGEEEKYYEEDEEEDETDEQYEDDSELRGGVPLRPQTTASQFRQNMQAQYAVVLFTKTNEMEVVAATWLSDDKNKSYWPPFKSPEKCKTAVEKREMPGDGWDICEVHLYKICETLEEAKQFQTKFEELVNPSAGCGQPKFDDPPSAKKQKLQAKESHQRVALPSLLPGSSQQFQTNVHRSRQKTSLHERDKKLFEMLEEIKDNVKENSKLLQELLGNPEVESVPNLTSKLPLKKQEDVTKIEKDLEDKVKKQALITHLSKCGGFTNKEKVKRMMQQVVTDDLALTFSWQGKGQKSCFSALKLARVIKDAAERQNVPEADAVKEIKAWLSYSAERCNRMKMKAQNKGTEPGTAADSSLI